MFKIPLKEWSIIRKIHQVSKIGTAERLIITQFGADAVPNHELVLFLNLFEVVVVECISVEQRPIDSMAGTLGSGLLLNVYAIWVDFTLEECAFVCLIEDGGEEGAVAVLKVIFPHPPILVAILPLKSALPAPDTLHEVALIVVTVKEDLAAIAV